MIDPEQQSPEQIIKHPSRSLNTTLWILGIFVVLTGFFVALNSGPPRLREGEIVSDLGQYWSPNNDRRIRISKTADGDIEIITRHSVSGFSIFRTFRDHPLTHFEHERGWFLCFDASDELWLFHGQWKREWGPLRTLPFGGTRPYPANVFRFSKNSGSCLSSHFDWRDVPAEFLQKIPNADESVWGHGCRYLPAVKQLSSTE
jgi:hypothetical protein